MIYQYGQVRYLQCRVLRSPKYANKESEMRSFNMKNRNWNIKYSTKLTLPPSVYRYVIAIWQSPRQVQLILSFTKYKATKDPWFDQLLILTPKITPISLFGQWTAKEKISKKKRFWAKQRPTSFILGIIRIFLERSKTVP